MVFRSGESAGLSGSFFFFSHDNKFIIKTLSSSDKKKLIQIMEGDYCSYLEQNQNSLLARIYGMYVVKKQDGKSIDLIIMENTADLRTKSNKMFAFDLKGSMIARDTSL